MRYFVKSLWAGKYSNTYHGGTNNIFLAVWWFVRWTALEFVRVLKLNKYHYGNMFGIGKKLTDSYGEKNVELGERS